MIEWILILILSNGEVHMERLASEPECDRIGSITLSAIGEGKFRCEPVKALK